ncbi:MAG TPA: hypothetical protein VGF32_29380 [Streptosporangiaceae bacterium]|jgi:hypothetical protein
MGTSSIEAAYQPFADTLQGGGFTEPDSGWNASQVGAHIALSNELFSDLAERMHRGDEVSFNNSGVVDSEALLAYATGLGGLTGLAGAVRTSAARLARAYDSLSPEERARPIPMTLWHEGQIVRDSPTPLGDLIVGNGDFHLAMHYEQLQALQPS